MDNVLDIKRHEELQERISKMRIYLPHDYSKKGTIDPSCCLEKDGKESLEIKPNLFGPICPEKYFSTDFRILWLLKESYITKESYDEGDRGGHNQAKDRYEEPLGDGKGDATYRKIIKTVSLLVNNKEIDDNEVFRNHTSILNVNIFPALCSSSSTDFLIGQWASINKSLLEQQLVLYKPTVIICGFTLQHFFPDSCNDGKHNPENIRKYMQEHNGINLLGYNIPQENSLFMDELYNEYGANYAFWNKDVVFIDAYHPAYRGFKSSDIKKCYDEVVKRHRSNE